MGRIISLILMALIATVVAVGQTTTTNADIKATILKLEDANNTAIIKGDAAAIRSLYADDFEVINASGGKGTKSKMIEYYAAGGSVTAVSETDDVSVRVIGRAAIVTARLRYQLNARFRNPKVEWMRYTRVYEQRGTTWVIVAEHFVFTPDPTTKEQ